MMVTHSTFDELLLHQKQRNSGRSVLSVLAGPVDIGLSIWENFVKHINRPYKRVSFVTPDSIINAWIDTYNENNSLLEAVIGYLAGLKNVDPKYLYFSLIQKSKYDRSLFLENVRNDLIQKDKYEFCKIILQDLENEIDNRVQHVFQQWVPTNCFDWIKRIKTIHDINPEYSPAILFNSNSDQLENLIESVSNMTQIVETIPQCPFGWVVTKNEYEKFLEISPESRAKAICQDSAIHIKGVSSDAIVDKIMEQNIPVTTTINKQIDTLNQEGVSAGFIEKYINALECISKPPETSHEKQHARSEAERLLYELLDSLDDTSGIFKLNERIPIPFGVQLSMEVDLISRQFLIAIEIDGYFHFNDPKAYKRDRNKDYLLQRHGYFVLRFYAEDIVLELDVVLLRIRQVLALRKEKTR